MDLNIFADYEEFKATIGERWRKYLDISTEIFEKAVEADTGYKIKVQLLNENQVPIRYPGHAILLLNPTDEISLLESDINSEYVS